MVSASLPLLLAGVVALATAQHLPLPALPYGYSDLEPVISAEALEVHHLGHHQTYTDRLNTVMAKLRADPNYNHLAKLGIDALLDRLHEVPAVHRDAVRNNGGGYVAHDLFWQSMAPVGKGGGVFPFMKEVEPGDGSLHLAVEENFTELSDLKLQFTQVAMQVFGSGYTWLVLETSLPACRPKLKIVPTSNQDIPPANQVPLLLLDVWEHAYYLQYKNRRADFITAWWDIVNWAKVEERFKNGMRECLLQKLKSADL